VKKNPTGVTQHANKYEERGVMQEAKCHHDYGELPQQRQ
jgi:hypothetical protein